METHPERAQQLIADPLFEIGSHGLRHLDLSHAKEQTLAEEITLTEAAYARARTALTARQCFAGASRNHKSGSRCFAFLTAAATTRRWRRPPRPGSIAVQWDLVTGDPDPRVSAKTIANTILTRAIPAPSSWPMPMAAAATPLTALAIALPKLKEQGYSFVTVSELLKAGKPVIAARCYQNNPGDMTRYCEDLCPARQP